MMQMRGRGKGDEEEVDTHISYIAFALDLFFLLPLRYFTLLLQGRQQTLLQERYSTERKKKQKKKQNMFF